MCAMDARAAIRQVKAARTELYRTLRALEGQERADAIRAALKSDVVNATQLAKGLGISRQRLYEIARSGGPTS